MKINYMFKKKVILSLLGLLVCGEFVFAQTTNIKGTVVDEKNESVIGASVKVKGNNQLGTVTDIDGNFRLDVPSEYKTIIISYIGMETQESAIKPVVNVKLIANAQVLDEVIITGYQAIDRKMFTGSASLVNADKAKTDGITDISRMLQGKAPGIQLTNVSNTFGVAPKLRVRGASSIYGNSNPLWVVDGVILEDMVNVSADDLSSGNAETLISSAVAGLNADDIENFQILKDASATALYGARAMNGVIVITTKKGRKGSAQISYTGEFTTRLKPSYSQFDILNSQDQMSVYMEMIDKGYLNSAELYTAHNGGVFNQMYNLIAEYDRTGNQFGLANTPEAMTAYLREAELRNTDWFDELFRNSLQQNHAVSISNGTDKSSTYASLSILTDPGWTNVDEVNRYTLNLNSMHEISKTLAFTMTANGSMRKQKAPGTISRSVTLTEGSFNRDFDLNPFSYALNTSRTMDPDEFYRRNYAPFNIKNEMENNYLDIGMLDTKVQGELSYKPMKELNISGLISYRYVKTSREHIITEKSNMAQAYRAAGTGTIIDSNNFLWQDPEDAVASPETVLPSGGFYNTTDNSLQTIYARATANYEKMLNEKHFINLLAGGEVRDTERQNRYNYGYGYVYANAIAATDYRMLRKMLDATTPYFGMDRGYDRSISFFGTGTYSYEGRYIFNGTLRSEGSNQMGKSSQARWLPTWNVSGAWNVLDESFMNSIRDNQTLSALKLRATYGLTAKNPPSIYASALAIITGDITYRPFQNDRESKLVMKALENKDLTWEKMTETNIGVDLGVLKNRISAIFDIYWRNSYDQIGQIQTSGLGGERTRWGNFADMASSGYEFIINTLNIKTKDFSWANTFTFSYNKTKITNLKSIPSVIELVGLSIAPKEGSDVRSLFSIPFAGLDEEGIPTFYNENGEKVYYIDFQNRVKTDYLKYEGPIDPKYIGGFENSLSYKGFKFDLYFTYQFGNVVRLYPEFSSEYSDMDAMTQNMKNRWTIPGDEAITTIPTIISDRQKSNNYNLRVAYNAYNFSTERVAKGDFIRLKDISLSYNIPTAFCRSIGLSALQLRAVASNMWLI
jgi:TonB-linked SusC/RagA family outer membrane protein